MKCLITGAGGFLGRHLAFYLAEKGHKVFAAQRGSVGLSQQGGVVGVRLDVTDKNAIFKAVDEIKPDTIYHLAGQSLILPSWKDPENTFRINVMGTVNLFEAVIHAGISPTILVACSSAEYKAKSDGTAVTEEDALEPSSPYAVSKMAQDYLCMVYLRRFNLRIIRMRPFLVTGPGKKQDVCCQFAQGIVDIENGLQKELKVGNLNAVRDFLDYRDALEAIDLMTTKGKPGDVYNLCSGQGTQIAELLKKMVQLARTEIKVVQDKSLLRPLDEAIRIGNKDKLTSLGWKINFNLEQTLEKILDYWRDKKALKGAGQ